MTEKIIAYLVFSIINKHHKSKHPQTNNNEKSNSNYVRDKICKSYNKNNGYKNHPKLTTTIDFKIYAIPYDTPKKIIKNDYKFTFKLQVTVPRITSIINK